jgi:transcriptional regulator with XRE-family HTH domain
MKSVSQRIQEGMEIRGLKQVDLVNMTGISKGALSSYLSGKYVPKQNNIYKIAKALNVSEAWLMGTDVPMEKEFDVTKLPPNPLVEGSSPSAPATRKDLLKAINFSF